jgi:hypothetical protein
MNILLRKLWNLTGWPWMSPDGSRRLRTASHISG